MDVTQQYLNTVQTYGASDSTNPAYLAATTHLNYAAGPTIKTPIEQICTNIPYTFNYTGEIGLHGTENIYVKVIDATDRVAPFAYIEEPKWDHNFLTTEQDNDMFYQKVKVTETTEDDSSYKAAGFNNISWFKQGTGSYISVDIVNNGVGIDCIDKWIDVSLYGKTQQPHQFKRIYIPADTHCYFGIHARNTRRMPFNVSMTIGASVVDFEDMTDAQRMLVQHV